MGLMLDQQLKEYSSAYSCTNKIALIRTAQEYGARRFPDLMHLPSKTSYAFAIV